MSASCCFIGSSCKKVEICDPYSPGKTDRTLSGKMTATSFSLMFSGCFVTLLIWAGHTTVVCLVNEKSVAQPVTTAVNDSTQMTNNATYGFLSSGCGNTSNKCEEICDICADMSLLPMDCLDTLLSLCLKNFRTEMHSVNSTDWCIWGKVSGFYSKLSNCTEEISDCLLIPWPNRLVEHKFVEIHADFFKDCPSEELSDPAPVIVFALVITPICLIPAMVSLVVLKTKNGDGSA